MRGRDEGPVWALGTMSGTSLDGVDAALLHTDGAAIHGFGARGYRAYSEGERAVLRAALGRWPGEAGVAEAAAVVEAAHRELLAGMLAAAEVEVALVGFHGQTLAHAPGLRGTHQAGSGQALAEALGVPVLWDFRSADVGFGGQGAPLAPFYHFACARWIGAVRPLAFLNLGGVGNLTWVDPALARPEEPGALLAFDTGPANAPLDDLTGGRDEGGALALSGRADEAVVGRLLEAGYFHRVPPKSLDRQDFQELFAAVEGMALADALATAVGFAAAAVAEGLVHLPAVPERVLVTGGGRHNRALMAALAARLPCAVEPVEAVGLDGDMLEAQAFAHLAVRVARGMPTSAPGTTGVAAPVGGGQISRPDVLGAVG